MSKNGFPGTPFKQDLVFPPWIRLVYTVLSDTSKLLSIYIYYIIEIIFYLYTATLSTGCFPWHDFTSINWIMRVFVTHDSIVILSSCSVTISISPPESFTFKERNYRKGEEKESRQGEPQGLVHQLSWKSFVCFFCWGWKLIASI